MKTCKDGHQHDEKRCPECQRMYDRNYRRSAKGREQDRIWQLANYDSERRYERYMRLEWPRALKAQREATLDAVEALRLDCDRLGVDLGPELQAYLKQYRPQVLNSE